MTVVEFDPKARIGKEFEYGTFKFYQVFLCQRDLLVEVARAPHSARMRRPRIGLSSASDRAQIHRRDPSALALLELVTELLTLPQIVHPSTLDRRDVNKHVSAAGFGLDEPVALLRIEPFDRTGRH